MPKRAPQALTDATIRNLKARPKGRLDLPDGLTPGLELRVTPTGAKSWTLRYRTPKGDQRRVMLGSYPAKSLRDARLLALEAIAKIERGVDPQAEKRASRAEAKARTIHTLKDLAESYLEHIEGRKAPRTIESDTSRIEKYIIPRLGALAVDKVTRAHVRSLARWIAGDEPKGDAPEGDAKPARKAARKEGGKVTANRTVALLRVMYAYAEDVLDLELRNPAARIGKLYAEETRARVLSDDELRAIWNGLDSAAALKIHMSESLKLAIKGLMLTLQRAGEMAGADAREIDFKAKAWTLPASRTKNRRAHVVPLSAAALDVFTQAHKLAEQPKRGPIFPTPRGRRQSMTPEERAEAAKPITRHAITRAMKRLCNALGIADATPHDLRRTGATIMASERLGVSRYIVSRCLNHTSDLGGAAAVTASVYARADDLPAKRAALDSWARLLLEIVSDEEAGGNVVPLRGAIDAG